MFGIIFSTLESLFVATMLLLFVGNAVLYAVYYMIKQSMVKSFAAVKGISKKIPAFKGENEIRFE